MNEMKKKYHYVVDKDGLWSQEDGYCNSIDECKVESVTKILRREIDYPQYTPEMRKEYWLNVYKNGTDKCIYCKKLNDIIKENMIYDAELYRKTKENEANEFVTYVDRIKDCLTDILSK